MSYAKLYEMKSIDGKAVDLIEALLHLSNLVRRCEGCEEFTIFRDSAVADSFTVIERWSSKAAHARSSAVIPPEAFNFLRVTLSEKPSVRECEVLSTG